MAVDISETSEQFALNDESLSALRDLASDAENEPKRMEAIAAITVDSKYAVVIKVGSYGVDTKKDNEEFWVDGVFFSPDSVNWRIEANISARRKRPNRKTGGMAQPR